MVTLHGECSYSTSVVSDIIAVWGWYVPSGQDDGCPSTLGSRTSIGRRHDSNPVGHNTGIVGLKE